MPSIRVHSASVEITEEIGRALGTCMDPGALLTMSGQLGAGKTAMTRGIAAGLGIEDKVTSPTFTLSQSYGPGTRGIILHHDDAYRLEGPEDFLAAGLAESLETDGVTVVEWAELVADALPEADVAVTVERVFEAQTPAPHLAEEQIVLPGDDVARVIRLQFADETAMDCFLAELSPLIQVLDKEADE